MLGSLLSTILEQRPAGGKRWPIAAPGIAERGVYPLFLVVDGLATPVGTAFLISAFGHLFTAQHNLDEALRRDRRGVRLLNQPGLPDSIDLRNFGNASFSVLHTYVAGNSIRASFCPLGGATGLRNLDDERTPSLDVSLAYLEEVPIGAPLLPLAISFELPRIGSTVYAVGYDKVETPSGPVNLEQIQSGTAAQWKAICRPSLIAVEARVTKIFTQGFASGFLRGACIAIDEEIPHGLSGCPVLDEKGRACGVASAGASIYFGAPASLVSLLYPTLLVNTRFGFSQGSFSCKVELPLVSLISRDVVDADGTESMVTVVREGDDVRVGPMIHKDDANSVFDDFRALGDGRLAEREVRPVMKVKRRTSRRESK